MESVRKAVIPVAGLGTRFLPATKAVPKEMLPLIDRPSIQYVVEEAVESGVQNIVFVTSREKKSIEDHFDRDLRLESELARAGKDDLLEQVRQVSRTIGIASVRQKEPRGLGHAVQVTEVFVGEEPFAVLLPDDIMVSRVPVLRQLMDVYEAYKATVIGVMEVPWASVSRYGVVAGEPVEGRENVFRVRDMVEKPAREEAPSNLAIMGRYILTPTIFQTLGGVRPRAVGEIQLTDGIGRMLEEEPIYACRFEGVRHDAGTTLGYLKTMVELALDREDLGEEFREYLKGKGL